MRKRRLSVLAKTLITFASVIALIIVLAASYVVYIFASYYRVGEQDLSITSNTPSEFSAVSVDTVYSITTYNIGFGAYSQDYTFFMDTGYDEDGNKTAGHWGKALSEEDVIFNTKGVIKTISDINPDFAMFQEVDTNSTRSYHVNQYEMITSAFPVLDAVFCLNFHSAYLPYPLYDMHGSVEAGLTTLSRYKIQSAQRKEYTISSSFSKLFDLDRCFEVNVINVSNGKKLYVVNSHMSAYDEGGVIRAQQIKELNDFLSACQEEGSYVIVGGDFNHDLLTYNPDYTYNKDTNRVFGMTKKAPDWLSFFFNKDGSSSLIDGYKVIASDNSPTCRNNDIEWIPDESFVCAVDGYIISSNILVDSIENIKTTNGKKEIDGFAYSDHEPVLLKFKLAA